MQFEIANTEDAYQEYVTANEAHNAPHPGDFHAPHELTTTPPTPNPLNNVYFEGDAQADAVSVFEHLVLENDPADDELDLIHQEN